MAGHSAPYCYYLNLTDLKERKMKTGSTLCLDILSYDVFATDKFPGSENIATNKLDGTYS